MIASFRDSGRAQGASFRLSPVARAQILPQLSAGPWCWSPLAADRAWMSALVPHSPPVSVGSALLLGVGADGQSAGVWALHMPCGHVSPRCLPLSGELLASWRERVRHLPRFVPIAWRDVSVPDSARAQLLGTSTSPSPSEFSPWRELTGRSYELPLLLASISTLFQLPMRGDCAFTGTVEWDGTIGAVGGLPAKLRAVREVTPGVRTVYIPAAGSEQLDLSDTSGQWSDVEPLKVEKLGRLDEALRAAFGEDALINAFVGSARNAEQQRRYCWDLLHFVKDKSRRHASYRALARAAEAAQSAWGSALDATGRDLLDWARAVCDRHDSNQGLMPIVPATAREAWAPELRLQYVADLVQQAADTGRPDPDTALGMAGEELGPFLTDETRNLRSAFDGQLELLGAVARLLALGRQPARALRLQEHIADAFWERSSWRENLSFQVSEWFRLAAALGDRASYQRAIAFDEQVQERGGYTTGGAPFVQLSRLSAQLALEGGSAQRDLEQIAEDERIAGHVRAKARRLLAMAGDEGYRQALLEETARSENRHQMIGRALVQVSRAETAADALATLQRLDPGPLEHIMRTAGTLGEDAPAYVARWYPY